MHKNSPPHKIVTRSQTSKKSVSGAQTHTNTCTCPQPSVTQGHVNIMNDEQKQLLQEMLTEVRDSLKHDIAKESHTNRAQLDEIQTRLEKKPNSSAIKPEMFDGNPTVDAMTWLDSFSRIANINNWSSENQLSAFPLYLSGVAHAWFLSLSETTKTDFEQLMAAFQDRFASGPQEWILSQQLSTRKQAKGERIDDYIADITRLCKRLKLSDADTVRYFTQGLQPQIQSYNRRQNC